MRQSTANERYAKRQVSSDLVTCASCVPDAPFSPRTQVLEQHASVRPYGRIVLRRDACFLLMCVPSQGSLDSYCSLLSAQQVKGAASLRNRVSLASKASIYKSAVVLFKSVTQRQRK